MYSQATVKPGLRGSAEANAPRRQQTFETVKLCLVVHINGAAALGNNKETSELWCRSKSLLSLHSVTMRPSAVASVVVLAAAVLLTYTAADNGSNWGNTARRQAYQSLRRRGPPIPHVNEEQAFAASVAHTRQRVKCRDSDIIMVSYQKVSCNHVHAPRA